jgi:hypothetical protein
MDYYVIFMRRTEGLLGVKCYEGAHFAKVQGMAEHNAAAEGYLKVWEGTAVDERDAITRALYIDRTKYKDWRS